MPQGFWEAKDKCDSTVNISVILIKKQLLYLGFLKKQIKWGSYFRGEKIAVTEIFSAVVLDTLKNLKFWWEEQSS